MSGDERSAVAAFVKAAGSPKNSPYLSPLEFRSLAGGNFGDGEALRGHIAAMCRTAGQSQDPIELPIASSSGGVKDETDVDFLILKTAARRGDLVEGWFRKRPTRRENILGEDGAIQYDENGTPRTRAVFTGHDTKARFKVSVNCQQRQIAVSRWVEYDKSGKVQQSDAIDTKLTFKEPIPGTLGEGYLEALCRL